MKTQPSLDQLISIDGKRALITGAAAGIGKAMTARFAEAGAHLTLVDIDSETLAATARELTESGVAVTPHVVDVSDEDAVDRLWIELRENEPDILVNNVGIYPFKRFSEVDGAFYDHVMRTNLSSTVWMCRQMIDRRRDRGGIIINIGSTDGIRPAADELSHYSISKAGVIALTRSLAKAHARHGFRVNAIVPGAILPSGAKQVVQKMVDGGVGAVKIGAEYVRRTPLGRLGRSDEVARIALVLASELASYVNGAVIPVDGGFLAA